MDAARVTVRIDPKSGFKLVPPILLDDAAPAGPPCPACGGATRMVLDGGGMHCARCRTLQGLPPRPSGHP